jgi:hypothetical protein
MALSAETQYGIARIYGIPPINAAVDEMTWSIGGTVLTAGSGLNLSSFGLTDSFKTDEIASADGSIIETLIGSQQRRDITIEFIPASKSDTPTRAEAEAFCTHLLANIRPLALVALSGFKASLGWVNGTFNYMGGAELMLKRDTYCVGSIRLAQFLTRADGAVYAALPIAS